MTTLALDIAVFRVQFPAYTSALLFPDITIQMYFDMASDYISTSNVGSLRDNPRLLALYLLTAHILFMAGLVSSGTVSAGVITSSAEGTVSVGFAPPPIKTDFDYYLSRSTYGQQLLALLQIKKGFGFYVGGMGTAAANIRSPNGWFG